MTHVYIVKGFLPSSKLTYPPPHIFILCVCVCVWRGTFKFYSLNKFQLFGTVLLTIVTMFYLGSSGLTHLIAESLYPFTSLSPFPQSTGPALLLFIDWYILHQTNLDKQSCIGLLLFLLGFYSPC